MLTCRSRGWRSVDRCLFRFPTRTTHSCARNWRLPRSRSRRIWMRLVVVLLQTGLRCLLVCCCCSFVMENQVLIIASVADHTALWVPVLSWWSFHSVNACLVLVIPHTVNVCLVLVVSHTVNVCLVLSWWSLTLWMPVLSWWSFHSVNACLVLVIPHTVNVCIVLVIPHTVNVCLVLVVPQTVNACLVLVVLPQCECLSWWSFHSVNVCLGGPSTVWMFV